MKTLSPPSFRNVADGTPTASKISRLLRKKWPENGITCRVSHTPWDHAFEITFIPDVNGITQRTIVEVLKLYFPHGGMYRLLFRNYTP